MTPAEFIYKWCPFTPDQAAGHGYSEVNNEMQHDFNEACRAVVKLAVEHTLKTLKELA